jgi:hypothetical protein
MFSVIQELSLKYYLNKLQASEGASGSVVG